MGEREELQQSLAALEAQRAVLGEGVVGPAITALREKLAALDAHAQAQAGAPAAGRRQRKLVTVMFADLVNFTAIAEHMDPEDVQALIKTYFDRWKEIIEQHGGSVEKFIGDAVMAVWGALSAHEDDAARAVRAALTMREALRSEAWSLEVFNRQRDENPFLASGLHMRVGINTGLVLVGELSENAQFTIIGDTVNTASRLEHAAPVDGVLISHDTYRQVSGLFETQGMEPLALKGKSELVQTYLVHQARPPALYSGTRGVEGIETRMVGRQSELEELQNAWNVVRGAEPPAPEQGRARSITIVGEAGLGKSRLLFEFQNWMEANPSVYYRFQARATESTAEMPYGLLRSFFAMRFQIQESDSPAVARQKLEEGLLPFFERDAQEKVHFIGQLLGYDYSASPYLRGVLNDSRQIRDRAARYLGEFIDAASARHPLVFYLEDIHWADDHSLGLLRQLEDRVHQQPVFVLVNARPVLLERFPEWGQEKPNQRVIHLNPLSKVDTYSLIEDILRKVRRIPPVLREMVAEQAEGNPFYVEELIKMLIDEGVILKGGKSSETDGPWRVAAERLSGLRVPPTLTGVLQARLDSLPEGERAALQVASVVGRIFWADAVRVLLLNAPEEELRSQADKVEELLAALTRHELVFQRRASAFAFTDEYVFKNGILHDVTYEEVLKSSRRIYHGAMACWLVGQSGERADENAGLIASHFEKAENWIQSAGWYYRAGRRAAAQFAHQEALSYLGKALSFTPPGMAEERYLILRTRVGVYDMTGARDLQAADLELLADLAERLGDVERKAETFILRANLAEMLGDYPTTQEMARRAIAAVEGQPEFSRSYAGLLRLAEGYEAWGLALLRQEEYAGASSCLEHALRLARDVPPDNLLSGKFPPLQADILRHMGNVALFQNNVEMGIAHHQEALELYERIGDLRGASYSLISLGALATQVNQLPDAIDYMERGLKLSEKIGDQIGQARALNNLGDVYAQLGDYERSLPNLVFAYEIFERINHRHGRVVSLANLQDVYQRLGRFDQAYACNRKWQEVALQTDDQLAHALAYQGAAHFYLCVGDAAHADEELRRAAEIITPAADPGRRAGLRYLQTWCAFRQGKLDRALELSEDALILSRQAEDPRLQGQLWTLIGRIRSEMGYFAEAKQAFQEAERLHLGSGFQGRRVECQLCLARVEMELGHVQEAAQQAQSFLQFLESSPTGMLEEPVEDMWTACCILARVQDTRAAEMLTRAYTLLQARAARMPDAEMRRCYLEEVPAHKQIQSEWEK